MLCMLLNHISESGRHCFRAGRANIKSCEFQRLGPLLNYILGAGYVVFGLSFRAGDMSFIAWFTGFSSFIPLFDLMWILFHAHKMVKSSSRAIMSGMFMMINWYGDSILVYIVQYSSGAQCIVDVQHKRRTNKTKHKIVKRFGNL